MPKRQYVCPQCAKLRRSAKVYSPERQHASCWPRCCGAPMVLLSFVQSEAATQVSAKQRIEWLKVGGYVIDRGGKHRWRPATSEYHIEEAKRQVAAYDRSAKKAYVPPD